MVTRIILNETSYHGAGAVKSIVAELAARGLKNPIVFSDPDLVKFGVTKKVTDILAKAKIKFTLYSDIKPNPTIENVKNGVKAAKKAKADCIVAIGRRRPLARGRRPDQEAVPPDSRRSDDCRHRGRSDDQLRHNRRREEAQVRLRRPARHSRRRVRRPRDDGDDAQGPHGVHRHGRAHPRDRGLHHEGRLPDD